MRINSPIRKTKGFKFLSKILVSVFLTSVVLNNGISLNKNNIAQAEPPAGSVTYQDVGPIDWTRTHDVRNEAPATFQVHNTRANFNGYFTNIGPNSYILDKKPAGATAEGIIWIDSLFGTNKYTFDYDMLETLLNPTDTNVWDGKGSNPYSGTPAPGQISRVQKVKNYFGGTIPSTFPDFATWQYCPWNGQPNPYKYGDQLRLFKGNFNLTADDLANYNFFIGIGDNKDLILPIDDTMMVLVDEQPVGINYTTDQNYAGKSIKIRNNSKGVTYDLPFKLTDNLYSYTTLPVNCNIESHKALTAHTDGLHVHLNNVLADGKILGDITDEITANPGTNHKIEILASDYNVSGGMTKLDIVKVKKPSTSITKEAYVDGNLISSSDTPSTVGTAKEGQNVNYKFKYSNLDTTPVYDLVFTDPTLNLSITKSAATFKGANLTDLKVTLIKADSTTVVGGKELLGNALNQGETIIVEAPSLNHLVTAAEANAGTNLSNTVSVAAKYYKDVPVPVTQATVEVKPTSLVPSVVSTKEAYADSNYLYPITTTLNGEKVYYKFKLENTGEVDLNNVTFTDNNFNGLGDSVVITKDGVKINGIAPATNNLIVKKYKAGSEIDTGVSALVKLQTLKVGETIEVTDSDNVYRNITATSGSVTNTVEGKGSYDKSGTNVDVTDNATVDVNVKNPKLTANKVAFTNVATQDQTAIAYPNQNIYYKFQLENTGTQDLNDVSFTDSNFNGTDSIMINSSSILINGVAPLTNNLVVKKYSGGIEIDQALSNFDKLKSLKIGEKLEITDTANLYRKINITDPKGTVFNNTVIGKGNYTYGGVDKPVQATASASVTVNNQVINVINEAYLKGTLVGSSENATKLPVATGSDIDYKITLTNNGPETITDVNITDTTLGVTITKDGVTKNGVLDSATTLVVNKYDASGNLIATGGVSDLATIFNELKPNEKIVVDDPNLLTAVQSVEGLMPNVAEATGSYQNGLIVKDTATVNTEGKIASIFTDKRSYVGGVQVTKSYPGQKVEYKLSAINNGAMTLQNISFDDPKLDINISKDGEYKISTNSLVLPTTLNVVVYTDNTESTIVSSATGIAALDLLKQLEPGQMIVVSDSENIIKNITASSEEANNTVISSGYTWDGTERKDDDSVTVSVRQPLMNIIKEAYDDANNVLISSSDKSLTTPGEAFVGNKVNYKFLITNDGATELKDIAVNDSQLGISLNSTSYSKDETNLLVQKYNASGVEIETAIVDQKSKLSNLDIGGYIVVSDKVNLSKTLTADDALNTPLSNTVLLNAKDPADTPLPERSGTVSYEVKNAIVNVEETAFIDKTTEQPVNKAYAGQQVFYKYFLENTGTSDLVNLVLASNKYDGVNDIQISTDGVKINNVLAPTSNLVVKKYDAAGTEIETNLTAIEKLANLAPGEKIVVTDTDNLYKNVTTADEGSNISNAVIGSGDYGYTGFEQTVTDNASVTLPVNKQQIGVTKEALVNNTIVASSENADKKTVYANQKVDYRLSIVNNGPEIINDVVFEDINLGVKISKDGIEVNGVKTNSPTLVLTKTTALGVQFGSQTDLVTMLAELKVGEKIQVTDSLLLTNTSATAGTIDNTLRGSAKYQNDLQISQDKTVTVPVIENNDVSIVKTIGKVTRDNNVIYDSSVNSISDLPERFYPEDKVEFNFVIKNTGAATVNNLYLTDVLKNQQITDVKDWTFTKDGAIFDHQNFSIAAGETINLTTTWTVQNECKKVTDNTVDLYRKDPVTLNSTLLSTSSVNFNVYPRVFVAMQCNDDSTKQFYVTVTGTDGFKTGMYLRNGEKVELDNLNFDVDYTVTETIPMNYNLTGMDITNGNCLDGSKTATNNLKFSLMTAGHPETVVVKNEKEESKQFRDDSEVTNTLKYTK